MSFSSFNIDPAHPKRIIFWGPVCCNKSTLLASGLLRVKRQGFSAAAFIAKIAAPAEFKESENEINITSREGSEMTARVYQNATQVCSFVETNKIRVVFLEEIQFMPDLVETLSRLSSLKVDVFMSGLSSTYKGEAWPVISEVAHLCQMEPMYAVCHMCGYPHAFQSLLVGSAMPGPDNVMIDFGKTDDDELYRPICQACFEKVHNDWNLMRHPESSTKLTVFELANVALARATYLKIHGQK